MSKTLNSLLNPTEGTQKKIYLPTLLSYFGIQYLKVKVGKRYLKVQGLQNVPKGPMVAKGS